MNSGLPNFQLRSKCFAPPSFILLKRFLLWSSCGVPNKQNTHTRTHAHIGEYDVQGIPQCDWLIVADADVVKCLDHSARETVP